MSWYTTGTVNLTNGSNTVIGVGTKWTNPLIGVCAGQMLILKTANTIEICEIASVQSDTQLTLANQYSGASQTGVSYEIPTAPKVSIENLALRISEMLNYYQLQMNGWQSILTGTGDITLTAPDGRVVKIKSQKAITEAIQKINVNGIGCRNILSDVDSFQLNGFGFIDKTTTKGNKPFEYAEIIQSGDSKTEAVQIALDLFSNSIKTRSGRLSKWNEWVDFITTANIYRYISVGDFSLKPFRANELPFGWYFRNGDNYLLNSPQGQALNSLSFNFKNDHHITIKDINGQPYINVPTAFAPDGRGFFERAVNGISKQVGSWEDDAIREIWGHFDTGVVAEHSRYSSGAFAGVDARNPDNAAFQITKEWKTYGYDFNASRIVPTANENRPINIGLTPAIYLGV